MTLGQRIQQLRKEKGLSQEALGEQLGVSRQAISKWESDITIPEIDKLISLAKQFGVSVGVLLGVEEDDPGNPAADELTDRELAAIEAIVGRYLEKLPQPQKPRRRFWLLAAVGIAVVLLLIFWFKGQLENLNDRMSNLQLNVNDISSTVSDQINGMTNQIQSALEQEASLLTDYSCEVTSVDIAAGTLLLDVQATPKEYMDGMEMRFTAEPTGEDPLTMSGTPDAGHTFRVEDWAIPLNDEIKLSVTFGTDGSWQTQTLEILRDWNQNAMLSVNVATHGYSSLTGGNRQPVWVTDWSMVEGILLRSNVALKTELELTRVELQLRKNGTVLRSDLLGHTEGKFQVLDYYTETPVADGDVLEFGVLCTDNFGRERFCSIQCVEFRKSESGFWDCVYIDPAYEVESVYDAIYE